MDTSEFDYSLPEAAIAQEAVEPRDASRLLRVSTMSDHRFSELPDLLAPGDLLVVNRTRVRKARIEGSRVGTGGKVELLLLRRLNAEVPERWEALVRPSRRMRPGVEIEVGPMTAEVLTDPDEGRVEIAFQAPHSLPGPLTVEALLEAVGELPLPPYFHGQLDDAGRYQTIFASELGSAAAPTAALHFTPELVARLRDRDIAITEVELEVGLDTFRPMSEGELGSHRMHRETYRVPESAVDDILAARRRGGRVVAVGTTVVRTLETAGGEGELAPTSGFSSLFITPGYEMRIVDALITNFHAPRTTLVVLVAALIGERWRHVYAEALERGYRFLSFGDAMLIEDLRKS